MPSEDFEFLNDAFETTQKKTSKGIQQKGKHIYFPSNTSEMYIVNAMTGVKYPWKVGTFDAQRLYNVVDSTTLCDNKGFLIKYTDKTTETCNPNYLYYDSPQQYMQHRKVTLDPTTIQAWRTRVSALFSTSETSDGVFNIEAYNKLTDEHKELMISNFKNRQKTDLLNTFSRTNRVEEYKPMYVSDMYLNKQDDSTWHLVSKKLYNVNKKA